MNPELIELYTNAYEKLENNNMIICVHCLKMCSKSRMNQHFNSLKCRKKTTKINNYDIDTKETINDILKKSYETILYN